MDPELECRVPAQFQALQSQTLLLYFALTEAVRDKYLVSSSLSQRFCLHKMSHDVTKVRVSIGTDLAETMVLQEVNAVFDKVGLIGKYA